MKRWFFEKSWRVILAGVLIVAIPLLGLAVFVKTQVTSALEDRLIKETSWFSVIGANQIEASLTGYINIGRLFVTRPLLLTAMKTGDQRELTRQLNILVANAPSLERAFISTPKGVQLSCYPVTPETIGKDFSARDWYKGVSQSWTPYVSEFYLRAAEPRRHLFAIAIPIREKERVIGILVLQPNADFLNDLLGRIDIGIGHMHVVDKNGILVYHRAFDIDRKIDYTSVPVVRKVMSGMSGVDKILEPGENRYMFSAYHPVKEWGWGVIVDKPADIVLAPIKTITTWIAAVTGFLLLLGGFFAYRGAALLVATQQLSLKLQQDEQLEKATSEVLALLNRPWLSLGELYDALLGKLKEHTCLEMGILHLQQDGQFAPSAAIGVSPPMHCSDLASECLRQKNTLRIRDIPSDSYLRMETFAGAFKPVDMLAVPLLYKDEFIGALELGCIHGFQDKDIKIFKNLAPQLAIGIDNLKKQLMMKTLSDERLRANEELQAMNEELQALNEELKTQQSELSDANRRLEEVSRTKSDFLANMSHELRTPLNSIIGFSEVLQDELFGPLSEKQREYVGNIDGSGRHLLGLINDILDLSKVESGKMEMEPSPFSLKNVLEASLTMFREKAVKHTIKIDFEIDADADRVIEADERKFKQIMYNLLSNALKFTPDGGAVRVSARMTRDGSYERRGTKDEGRKTEEKKSSVVLTSEASDRPASIEISVADTGIGIRPGDLHRLFREFTQLESAYTKNHEGTGLGLALTRKLVEFHGGDLRVESEFGKGSRFIFTLPVRQDKHALDQAAAPVVRRSRAAASRDLRRALVIDDDPKTRELVSAALTADGYDVVAAASGAAGLEAALTKQLDLIVLDLMLPGMSGFEVAERLRTSEKTAAVPIIVLTAMDLPAVDRKRLIDYSCSIIEKGSVTKNTFVAMIESVVKGQGPPRTF